MKQWSPLRLNLFALFFVIISKSLYGQEVKPPATFGVSAAISFNENWSMDPIYSYSLTGNFGKHSVFAGVLLTHLEYYLYEDPTFIPGFQAGYQYFPFNKKKFSPYIEYDLNIAHHDQGVEGRVICEYCNYDYISITFSQLYFSNNVSLGVEARLPWNFHLNVSAGSDLGFTQFKYTTIHDKDDPISQNTGLKLAQYFPVFLKAGLGINLFKLKKHTNPEE